MTQPTTPARQRVRLMLVEDDPRDAELVRLHAEMFEQPAEVVAHATSRAQALEILAEGEDVADVIVSDLGLPDADGFEVVSTLVAAAPDLPVIVLTGRSADGNPALEAGAQDYLVKQDLRAEDLERACRYAISRQATINALRATTRDVEHLVYSVTHDLKGPLTVASGFTEMLREAIVGQVDEDEIQMLDAVARSHQRMANIVSDLLEYARAVHGALRLDACDLDLLVKDVVNGMSPDDQGRITVSPLPTIHADERLLRHVFENLLGNAVKYARPGVEAKVDVSARPHALGWRIEVDDNGRGIPEASRERVFDIFVRSPEIEEISGTGIGLSICRRAVERHGGRIFVAGKDEPGTRMVMILPQSAQSFDAAPGSR